MAEADDSTCRPQCKSPFRIVLCGGGHSHIQVIQQLSLKHVNKNIQNQGISDLDVQLTVISPSSTAYYSGMIPAIVAGQYKEEHAQINVEQLARDNGWRFMRAIVTKIIHKDKVVTAMPTAGNAAVTIPFDILSVDVGSQTRLPWDISTAPFAVATRPIDVLSDRLSDVYSAWRRVSVCDSARKVVVAGGGAAGVELAFAIQRRIAREFPQAPPATITLVEGSNSVLPSGYGTVAQGFVEAAAAQRGVVIITGARVASKPASPDDRTLQLTNGQSLDYDLLVFASGAAAYRFLREATDLTVDERGFLSVTDTLQCVDAPSVFAAGDCCSMSSYSGTFPPKAGVYAVRMGPVLARNIETTFLRMACTASKTGDRSQIDKSLEHYVPQSDFLSLLNLCDGTAIGAKFGIAFAGPWLWLLKDWIDVSWMKAFGACQDLTLLKDAQQQAKTDHDVSIVSSASKAAAFLFSKSETDVVTGRAILDRMASDTEFCNAVVDVFTRLEHESGNTGLCLFGLGPCGQKNEQHN